VDLKLVAARIPLPSSGWGGVCFAKRPAESKEPHPALPEDGEG
jgi:hypothetical protein